MSDLQEPNWLDITKDPEAEHEFRMRELETTHEYSLKLLEARLMDSQREREYQKTTNRNSGILIAFLSLLFAAGIC